MLLGLRLGEDSRIEACREIRAQQDAPRLIVFTVHTGVEDIAAATLAGADGYLNKRIAGEEIIHTVGRTHAGGYVWLLQAAE